MNKQEDLMPWKPGGKVFNPVFDYECREKRYLTTNERIAIRTIGKESSKIANKIIEKVMRGEL